MTMRFLTVILVVLLFVSVPANGQMLVASARSYAATDTTGLFTMFAGDAALWFWAQDSCNVKLHVDYRVQASAPWLTYTVTGTDSTNSDADTGVSKSYILRRGSTNNIPLARQIRVRVERLSTKNGVTSPTYTIWVDRD